MAESATDTPVESHEFKAETKALLNLVINSLYTHKEVFLRELLSNASDALDKARLKSLTDHDILGDDKDFEIVISPDKDAGTLTISDNGIGMTHDELLTNLGTIAKSGSKAFVEMLSGDAGKDASLIGQFGVGFYSAYLVADDVHVTSRSPESDEVWCWSSTADGKFVLQPAERERRGTEIVLHLKADQREFLEAPRLRHMVKTYSDFVGHPIKLVEETTEGEGDEAKATKTTETINTGSALWTRSKSEITDEQYKEFYKNLGDWDDPLAWSHFKVEGVQMYTGLMFVPKRPPFDLMMGDRRSGVRLYVKRVFVMDECDVLLPEYLRFVKGIVDSDDLPLNVSREILQRDDHVEAIKRQLTKRALKLLEEMAKEKTEDYDTFWESFGPILKEGLHLDRDNQDRLAKLLRFKSTHGEGWTSLAEYVERMPAGQEAIHFISGQDPKILAQSPHIEGLKAKGYEVLFLTDPVDEWVTQALTEFEDKPLRSAMKGELKLDPKADSEDEAKDDEAKPDEDEPVELAKLTEAVKAKLGDRVKEVRATDRLTDSAVCLVAGENDYGANLERILRAQGGLKNPMMMGGAQQRTMELNPNHPLVQNLDKLVEGGEHEAQLGEWFELLYDQALLTEGSPIADPAGFARRMTQLLLEAAKSQGE
jgi:molecular chaperone HtpG